MLSMCWVSDGEGLSRVDGASHVPSSQVRSITQTDDGYLWLATPRGLVRYDGTEWRVFNRESDPTLADDAITTVLRNRRGYLWVGSERGGLMRYDGRQFTAVSRPNQIGGQWSVARLYQQDDGMLWIATPEDLLVLEPRSTAADFGLPGIRVTSLGEDASGYLWATAGSGLVRRVHNTFQTISLPLGFPTSPHHAFARQPASQALLVGREDGLVRLEGDFARAGLPQDLSFIPGFEGTPILHLVSSGERVIVGTEQQLSWLSADRETVPTGLATPSRIEAVFEDRDDHLWIGTREHGLWRLPSRRAAALPRATITNIDVGDGSRPGARSVILEAGSSSLRLHVAAPYFAPDSQVFFRHRLAHADDGWHASDGGWITYGDLAPGTYQLEVQAATRVEGELLWGDTASFQITQLPGFHQTQSFWLWVAAGVALALTLLTIILWQRRRTARFLEEMRRQEAEDFD